MEKSVHLEGQLGSELKRKKEQIEEAMLCFWNDMLNSRNGLPQECIELLKILKDFTLRKLSKRIRPTFMIYGYKCVNSNDEEEIIKASLSVELLEASLLIHDDVMDNDIKRRGGRSVWKMCQEHYRDSSRQNPRKRGKNIAIIAGNICFGLAIDIIVASQFYPELRTKAIRKFSEIYIDTGFGQQLDVLSEGNKTVIDEEIISLIQEMKTAKYTIEGPLHLGAILGDGGSTESLKILSDYGIPLGCAFQIQDDILGLFGSEEKIGKPVGSDIREGKQTLLIFETLKRSNTLQRKKLLNVLHKKEISQMELDLVKEIVKETGALECVKNKAVSLATQAKKIASRNPFHQVGKDFLINIADYIITRDF